MLRRRSLASSWQEAAQLDGGPPDERASPYSWWGLGCTVAVGTEDEEDQAAEG